MGKYLKLWILDAIIVVVDIILLSKIIRPSMTIGAILLVVLIAVITAVIHCGAYLISAIKAEKELYDIKEDFVKTEEEQYAEYWKQLSALRAKEPSFAGVMERFNQQVKSFNSKEESLISIIELNNGAAKEFLISRNDEVQSFLLKNLKKFAKRLIVYSAKTEKNRTATIEEDPNVMSILKNNDELIDLYDKLLDEVAMMGDDFNIDDPGLQSVIESLKELRVANDVDDEEDDGEITLHVASDLHSK